MPAGTLPFSFAERQIEIDRLRIADSRIQARKTQKLASSPHAFLRGSAPLFYEILRQRPDLAFGRASDGAPGPAARGPSGLGWIVGDMHLENVGAYRTDGDEVVFDLNDFDEACVGPWQLDVLRLTTSVLLASRTFDGNGHLTIDSAERAVRAYAAAAFDGVLVNPESSKPVAKLIEQCRARKRNDFVRANTEEVAGQTRIKRKRAFDVDAAIAAHVPGLLADYVRGLGDQAPSRADRWRVVDVALRIAGNGSLGRVRLWVLLADGAEHRFVELKECGAAAPEILLGALAVDPAERVVAGMRSMLERRVYRLAPIAANGDRSAFTGRRLRPEEDKLALEPAELGDAFPEIVTIVAGLLGRAHRRAATAPPAEAWTAKERDDLLERAIELAALHEGAWLAYSCRTRDLSAGTGD